MSTDLGGRFGLGVIDQVAYVVADMESALPRYEAIYGPFEISEAAMDGCLIDGREASCTLKLAVNRAGPIEIELIEVLDGKTTHSEHLQRNGEGLHHVRFSVSDLDQKLTALEQEGFKTVMYKRFGPTVVFAYLETPENLGPSVIELLEMGA
jgi:methylmalonyl-CoA/ethylmalonyl-CoA epimerase